MKATLKRFGVLEIDGKEYRHDVVIDRGVITKRNKKASKAAKSGYGHTPLTAHENIPWKCKTLMVGTGTYGSLPIQKEIREEAHRRNITLITDLTPNICKRLADDPEETNSILHSTC